MWRFKSRKNSKEAVGVWRDGRTVTIKLANEEDAREVFAVLEEMREDRGNRDV